MINRIKIIHSKGRVTYPGIDAVRNGVVAAGDLLDDFVVERRELGELLRHCRFIGGHLKGASHIFTIHEKSKYC